MSQTTQESRDSVATNQEEEVFLHAYDLSQGLVAAYSGPILGFTVDGIWHTGVYAFGREYYFAPEGSSTDFPGIKNSTPEEFQKKTGYSPTQTIRMGTTTKTREEFEQYLLTIRPRWNCGSYELLSHNCNNFSELASQYLVGKSVPYFITYVQNKLPRKLLNTMLGRKILSAMRKRFSPFASSLLASYGTPHVPSPAPTPNPACHHGPSKLGDPTIQVTEHSTGVNCDSQTTTLPLMSNSHSTLRGRERWELAQAEEHAHRLCRPLSCEIQRCLNRYTSCSKADQDKHCGARIRTWEECFDREVERARQDSRTTTAATTATTSNSVFSPQSLEELKSAIEAILQEYEPKGDWQDDPHGPVGEHGPVGAWDVSRVTDTSRLFFEASSFVGDISKWDVSRVTDMSFMFFDATLFNSDVSKWDVSSVEDMDGMFSWATAFNSDISKWDVSGVTTMAYMFRWARSFNSDLSKWDVRGVTDMDYMFDHATSFKQQLCGSNWVNSIASITSADSLRTIPLGVCTAFLSRKELKSAVDRCLRLLHNGDCSIDPHGPIGEWDVARVTDMSNLFSEARSFNGDISKWDVSKVKTMSNMFYGAKAFNGDVSKWDVSKVTDMNFMFTQAKSFSDDISEWDVSKVKHMAGMFMGAMLFNMRLCRSAWVHSMAGKYRMFEGSPGSISRTVCGPDEYVTRRPILERELIARTPVTSSVSTSAASALIANMMACPKCGLFEKSGRASCCAPGGAWFKNCGGAANKKVAHRWSEGVEVCKPAVTTIMNTACSKCGIIKKSAKMSCCGRGGSWFKNCGALGNTKLAHTWLEGTRACKTLVQGKAKNFGQRSNAGQRFNSLNGFGTANSTAVVKAAHNALTFPSANTSVPMPGITAETASMNTVATRNAPRKMYNPGTKNFQEANTKTATTIISSANMSTPTPSVTPSNISITTSMPNDSNNMLITTPFHTTALTATTPTTTVGTTATAVTTSSALMTLSVKEAASATEWMSQDSVEMTIILTCMVFALIIVFTMVGCFFIRKTSTTIKEGLHTATPQTAPRGVIKNV